MSLNWAPLGDNALVLSLRPPFDHIHQRQLIWLAQQLTSDQAIAETVPGMGNLTLVLHSPRADMSALAEQAIQSWQKRPKTLPTGTLHRIGVRYDGPDLRYVADYCGLSEEEVIARHIAPIYDVAFVGFMPGFAYLTGMDKRLAVPRRASPRIRVQAGAVGIAGAQTGIYPRPSPGGWQVIGYTTSALFDPQQQPPALLQPGDQLQFEVLS
ncbi:5-oxoprolinase subunit PxpB [Gallaecimonas sp. GXIMD1310]|uniref:5-oxoprolinase subunit PxpB n=1 Tax=Gallaecimonas sp. GXIMD1310 TaxID=3131926 RepID=UPI00324C20CB